MTTTVGAGEGQLYEAMGHAGRIKLGTQETFGRFTLVEADFTPGYRAPLRLHRCHAETFYVLEGELAFTLDRETVWAGTGTTVHVPPNTPYAVRSEEAGRLLRIISPAAPPDRLEALAGSGDLDRFDTVDLAEPPVPDLLLFYDLLLAGDGDALQALFVGEPRLDAPGHDGVQGEHALIDFIADQGAWLSDLRAQPHFVDIVTGNERVIVELILDVTQDDETFDLPVVLAADGQEEGVSAIRIYHGTWPLAGAHAVRAPIIAPAGQPLAEPAVVQAYTAGLREPDVALVLSLFAEDGYVREPSGARYRHASPQGLREFYGSALRSGGIVVHHCTATVDDHACAVEYVCDEWANTRLPAQAGLAVYELAGPGKLRAARIYDDVEPPPM